MLSINVNNKKFAPRFVSFNEKIIQKIWMIFDVENWLWKTNFGTFLAKYPALENSTTGIAILCTQYELNLQFSCTKGLGFFLHLTILQESFRHGHLITGTFWHGDFQLHWHFGTWSFYSVSVDVWHEDFLAQGMFNRRTFLHRDIAA